MKILLEVNHLALAKTDRLEEIAHIEVVHVNHRINSGDVERIKLSEKLLDKGSGHTFAPMLGVNADQLDPAYSGGNPEFPSRYITHDVAGHTILDCGHQRKIGMPHAEDGEFLLPVVFAFFPASQLTVQLDQGIEIVRLQYSDLQGLVA